MIGTVDTALTTQALELNWQAQDGYNFNEFVHVNFNNLTFEKLIDYCINITGTLRKQETIKDYETSA